jgi:DnaJ homolog subfamily A member 2
MPSHRHHTFGNLYIHFDVKFPQRIGGENGLTPEDVIALENILPPRIEPPKIPADAMTDDFVLEDLDPTREGRSMGATEEDEDEMAGGDRVQCATQ